MTRNNYNLQDHPQFGDGIENNLANRRRGQASSVPAGTTFIVSNFPGFAHAAIVGTGAAAASDAAGGPFVICAATAGSGDSSTIVTSGPATRRDWNPWIRFNFVTGNVITSVRWWMGAFASDPSALANLTSISGACLGYDTAVDGTVFWRCESGNASTTQKTTTTVPVTANMSHTVEIRMDTTNARVDFFMASHGLLTAAKTASPLVRVASHSTSVPVAATPLLIGTTVTTLSAAARRILLGNVALSHG